MIKFIILDGFLFLLFVACVVVAIIALLPMVDKEVKKHERKPTKFS